MQMYENFEKSLVAFKEAVEGSQANPESKTHRDALFLRFVHTYEDACETLEQYLDINSVKGDKDRHSFPNMIRWGAQEGLLKNSWDKWAEYNKARNTVVHRCDEKVIPPTLARIKEFYTETNYFLDQMKKRAEVKV